jgi:hypothetical protein
MPRERKNFIAHPMGVVLEVAERLVQFLLRAATILHLCGNPRGYWGGGL